MDHRTINEHYAEIAAELIDSEPSLAQIKNSTVGIVYLSSTQAKSKADKVVYGQCEKVAEKYKWGIPCEYTITVFEPNVVYFTEDQIRILLFHELLHIKIELGDDGVEKYGIRGHDLEDFKEIIDSYGTDWDKVEPIQAPEEDPEGENDGEV